MYHKHKPEFYSFEMNFDATTIPDVPPSRTDEDIIEECPIDKYDSFSTTSTIFSSISDNQLYSQRSHGLENVTPSTSFGNISVQMQNVTDVTFGNKIIFNRPVEINQLVLDYGEQNAVVSNHNDKPIERKLPWRAQCYIKHPCKVCLIASAVTLVATLLTLVGYYYNPFENTICVEVTSEPTAYTCGFATPCIRCKAMFSHKEVCRSRYDDKCGDLRCFCKPRCVPEDCQT